MGQLALDGFGGITGFDFDLNNGGTTSWGNSQGSCNGTKNIGNCTYVTQPSQDILFSASSAQTNDTIQFRIFPTALNSGFLLGTGPTVTVGKIESQVPGAFPLPFVFGSDLMVSPTASLVSGTGSLGRPIIREGPVAGNEDESDGSLPSGFMANLPFNGKYGPSTLPNGQGLMYLDNTLAPTMDFWVISPYKMMGIGVSPGAVPNVIIFEN